MGKRNTGYLCGEKSWIDLAASWANVCVYCHTKDTPQIRELLDTRRICLWWLKDAQWTFRAMFTYETNVSWWLGMYSATDSTGKILAPLHPRQHCPYLSNRDQSVFIKYFCSEAQFPACVLKQYIATFGS